MYRAMIYDKKGKYIGSLFRKDTPEVICSRVGHAVSFLRHSGRKNLRKYRLKGKAIGNAIVYREEDG